MADIKVFAVQLEDGAQEQIDTIANCGVFDGSKIRIMPDAHIGIGCVIGFTADLSDKVIPNIVGVDIGCGVLAVRFPVDASRVDLEELDACINKAVPAGFHIHQEPIVDAVDFISQIRCIKDISSQKWNAEKWNRQLGTLGGGNHFIELAQNESGQLFLIVHSGSRNLGNKVAEHYQSLAVAYCCGLLSFDEEKAALLERMKAERRAKDIQSELQKLKASYSAKEPDLPRDLCYITGQLRDDYLHDMRICQEFAHQNRVQIVKRILATYSDDPIDVVCDTAHNYIDDSGIVRKGAVSAQDGETLIIPLNMRDGSLICEGRGNPDWNYSAPHGAGRIMGRKRARKELSVEQFTSDMEGIYSSTVCAGTIDESPRVYKPSQEILDAIEPTVKVVERLRPLYNFKAVGD